MGILIFILFMMIGILGFAVLLLFMRQNRMMEMEKNQQKQLQESEEIMSTFLMELKADNEAFLVDLETRFSTKTKEDPLDGAATSLAVEEEIKPDAHPPVTGAHSHMLAKNAYQKKNKGISEQAQDNLSLHDQVLYMASQGFSVGDIAEKLHKGKTEIELILKFNEK